VTNVSVKTNDGKRILLYRGYTSSPGSTLYTNPTVFELGTNNSTPSNLSTSIDYPIPISNGTVNDNAQYVWSGSLGGTTTTSNVSVYKEGAGQLDNTAQSLLTTGSNVVKQWTKSTISANVVKTQPISSWIYIKDAATLAKFSTTTTALEIHYAADADNFYMLEKQSTDLATGWNLITSNKVLVSNLTVSGTAVTLSRLDILIRTNNAADAFVAGDVVYDLTRQWATSDLQVGYDTSYPTFDYTKLEVTRKVTINSAQANGYNINVIGTFNTDTTPLLSDIHTLTADSKNSTDEIQYFIVDRFR
jgi:hypothetical protein